MFYAYEGKAYELNATYDGAFREWMNVRSSHSTTPPSSSIRTESHTQYVDARLFSALKWVYHVSARLSGLGDPKAPHERAASKPTCSFPTCFKKNAQCRKIACAVGWNDEKEFFCTNTRKYLSNIITLMYKNSSLREQYHQSFNYLVFVFVHSELTDVDFCS